MGTRGCVAGLVLTTWGQLLRLRLALRAGHCGLWQCSCPVRSGESPFVDSVSLLRPFSSAGSQPLSGPGSVANGQVHLTYREACRLALWAALSLEVILVSTGITYCMNRQFTEEETPKRAVIPMELAGPWLISDGWGDRSNSAALQRLPILQLASPGVFFL